MKRSARLVLAKETLSPLTYDELADVAGGTAVTEFPCPGGYSGVTGCSVCDAVTERTSRFTLGLSCVTCPCH